MSPFELGILLHYYACLSEAEEVLRTPPILESTMQKFIDEQLLVRRIPTEQATASFGITERGVVLVEHICGLPLPVWKMP